MTKPLRLQFAGVMYNVTSHGDRRQSIYEDDEDRAAFLAVLTSVVARCNWLVHAYCLMGSHDHRLTEFAEQRSYPRNAPSAGRAQPGALGASGASGGSGDESFIDDMRGRIEQSNRILDEVPKAQRARRARPLAEYKDEAHTRNQAIALAYA